MARRILDSRIFLLRKALMQGLFTAETRDVFCERLELLFNRFIRVYARKILRDFGL